MSEPSATLETVIESLLRRIVREEIKAAINSQDSPLLTPEQLAERLAVPLSWVYEQSRQGNIPTHRIGKYIRFNLAEVVSQKKNRGSP